MDDMLAVNSHNRDNTLFKLWYSIANPQSEARTATNELVCEAGHLCHRSPNHGPQETFVHNVTRTPSAGDLGIGDEATLTVHFNRKVYFSISMSIGDLTPF